MTLAILYVVAANAVLFVVVRKAAQLRRRNAVLQRMLDQT